MEGRDERNCDLQVDDKGEKTRDCNLVATRIYEARAQ